VRRRGAEGSRTRAVLIDVAMRLMLQEGHSAVTARRVAAEAGVNPGLVHYYFSSMNELFLAVFRQGAEANLRRQARALAADQPLRSFWKLNTDPRGAKHVRLLLEFTALAQSQEEIRAEVTAYAERFRAAEKQAFAQVLAGRGADAAPVSPAALSVLVDGVSRAIAMERAVGITDGHAEVITLIDEYLRRLGTPCDPGQPGPHP
jgi:AcrR family transcriptional regulator